MKYVKLALSVGLAVFIYATVDVVHRGGPVMVALILCSIFSMAVIADKFRQLSLEQIDAEVFLKDVFESIGRQRIKEALDMCDRARGALSRVLKVGILKYDRPKDEIHEALEYAFACEKPALEKNLVVLSAISQVAPLLGFVGTLSGMIKVLLAVQSNIASSLSVGFLDIMPGLWEAFICTLAGFLIVIPVVLAQKFFCYRLTLLAQDIQRCSTELLNFLLERRMPL